MPTRPFQPAPATSTLTTPISTAPVSMRTVPICRYLFRRVAVVSTLAGFATCVALPVFAEPPAEPPATTDSGSLGPIVSIVKPEFSEVLKSEAQIVIAVQPRRYPAESVELLVDGRSVSGVLGIQNTFKWRTALFPDGQHTLTVRVTDTQGFIGVSETKVFINNAVGKTDTTAPILNWVELQNGQKLSGETTVRLDARDDFGVKYVFLRLNLAIMPDIKPPLASWMTNRPPYEFKIDTSKYEDGLYVLDAYAWDAKENEESAPRLTVGFFNHGTNYTPGPTGTTNPPTVTTNPPTGTTNSPSPNSLPPTPPEFVPDSATHEGALSDTSRTSPGASLDSQHNDGGERVSSPPTDERNTVRIVKVPTQHDDGSPALTMRHSTDVSSVLPPSVVAPNQLDSLPGKQHTAPGATRPDAMPRIAGVTQEDRTPSSATMTGVDTGLNATSEGVISARFAPERMRIASVLPDELLTPPGQDVWKPIVPSVSTQALATMLPTSPHTDVAPELSAILGATLGAARGDRTPPRTTAPPVIKAEFVEPMQIQHPDPGGSDTNVGSSQLLFPPLPPAPADSHVENASLTALRTGASTRIAQIPAATPDWAEAGTQSPRAVATLPRMALRPNTGRTAVKSRLGAAIVVSPLEYSRGTTFTATRDESLSVIAARFKMSLVVVAAANGLQPEARIKKGTQLLIPQSLRVTYKDQAVTSDVAPLLIGDLSVTPFRFLFEQQGGKITWDESKKQVTAKSDKYEVTITLGSDKAIVNQKEELMDMAAFLLSGRTMVPVRFFEKALHSTVHWEPSTGRVYVASTP